MRSKSNGSKKLCDCEPKRLGIKCEKAKISEYKELIKLMKYLNQEDPPDGENQEESDDSEEEAGRHGKKIKLKGKKKGKKKKKKGKRGSMIGDLSPDFNDRIDELKELHCPLEPIACDVQTANRIRARMMYRDINRANLKSRGKGSKKGDDEEGDSEDEEDNDEEDAPHICFYPPTICKIVLPPPTMKIKHADSNVSIIHVASPHPSACSNRSGTSGADPNAEVQPTSGFNPDRLKLRKPRSGLYINEDDDFIAPPDIISLPPMEKEAEDLQLNIVEPGICDCHMPSHKRAEAPVRKRKSKKGRKGRKARRKTRHRLRGLGERKLTDIINGDLNSDYGEERGSASPQRQVSRGRSMKSIQKYLQDADPCEGDPDDIPDPEMVPRLPYLKRHAFGNHSLTYVPCPEGRDCIGHFGIIHGSFNMFDPKFADKSRGKQALPMCVMGYCMAYHYHPKQWSMKVVDTIVDVGDLWFQELLDKMHDHSAVRGLCEVLPYGKKEYLILNGKRMQVLLYEPEIVGYTLSKDPTIFNLCKGLKVFFKDRRAGIFLSRNMKLAIWKDKVCYFIFDPTGRDDQAFSNFSSGRAALINVQTLQAVAEIILLRSPVDNIKFILSELKILKMMDEAAFYEDDEEEVDENMTPQERAMLEYNIINESYAILNASFHLGDKCFGETKFKQSLPIAVAAMSYAKISPPNTWIRKTVDKILKIGNKIYLDCAIVDPLIDVTIDDIPNEVKIGQYNCEIIIYRNRVKGQLFILKDCLMNIHMGLEEFFDKKGFNAGILQFNIYTLALWRQNGMYYTFDPYPRSPDGLTTIKGKACTLMQLNVPTMGEMIERNWNFLPKQTLFTIHAFKVLRLKKGADVHNYALRCTASREGLESVVDVSPRPDGDYVVTKVPHQPTPKSTIAGDDAGDNLNPELEEIQSLVDSIRDDYVPKMSVKCGEPAQDEEIGVVELDSPTLSATQVIRGWPEPRDKRGEEPEPDPDPEPEPPPPPVIPEGGLGEAAGEGEEKGEEEEEEEEDDKKGKKGKATPQEESPPPPPSPQPEPEPVPDAEEMVQVERHEFDRVILLPSDAKKRHRRRMFKKRVDLTMERPFVYVTADMELSKRSNFRETPDGTQIIVGTDAIDYCTCEVSPFVSIMAVVTSHKYLINSWSKSIVNFVTNSGQQLYAKRADRFQSSPAHVFPRIVIGHHAWNVVVVATDEGEMRDLKSGIRKWLSTRARGVLTTPHRSWAIIRHNGLLYLFDGGPVSAVGVNVPPPAKAALMRFTSIESLVNRIHYNNGSTREHFVLSRVIVMPTEMPQRKKGSSSRGSPRDSKACICDMHDAKGEEVSRIDPPGFKNVGGHQTISSTIGLKQTLPDMIQVKECHFIGTVAMLMLALRPIENWDSLVMDTVFEKGLQIYDSACNLSVTETRTIKNIALEDVLFNLNIRMVETAIPIDPTCPVQIIHFLSELFCRRRFIMIRYPTRSIVVHFKDGFLYLFNPYADEFAAAATWTKFCCLPDLVHRICAIIPSEEINNPEFYSYELSSAKKQSRKAAFNYRMSPLFQTEELLRDEYEEGPRRDRQARLDEKISWLRVKQVPWTRSASHNTMGVQRRDSEAMLKAWDVEIPHDLYSLWGNLHPLSMRFEPANRGRQILAVNVIAIAMTYAYEITEWTPSILDAIVKYGDQYHTESMQKVTDTNHEVLLSDLNNRFQMYPYRITVCFNRSTYGVIYSFHPDINNLSAALDYFFEKSQFGILVSTAKNLAFGRIGSEYFMFDCQTVGMPVFPPHNGTCYVLRSMSFNRFLYCLTLTLNAKRHNVPFDLYHVDLTMHDMS